MASQRVVVAAILGLIAVGGGVGVYLTREPPAPAPKPVAPITEPEPAPATPQFPVAAIEQAITGGDEVLPELFDSDGFVRDALGTLGSDGGLAGLLVSEHLIDRFVGFVDALPGRKLPVAMWPLKPAPGKMLVDGTEEPMFLATANAQRYDRAIDVFAAIDPAAAVGVYVKLYPLLQQSYRGLGNGDAYFNDRVVAVIDHMVAAPDPADPIAVWLDEKGSYRYRDPQFENASAGHKFLLRIGAGHRATVKGKLREYRALLTAQALPLPPTE